MKEKGYIFTIYNLCTEQEEVFFAMANLSNEADAELFLMDLLAKECFCDAWDFVSYEEVNEEYINERNASIKKYNAISGCDFEEDFTPSATLESIKESIICFSK